MNKWEAVLDLAEHQHSVVTADEVIAQGVSRASLEYWIAQRRLVALFPSVYRLAGARPTARQRAYAATTYLGPPASVSHATGTALLRLDGVARTCDLHLTVLETSRSGRFDDSSIVVHRVRVFGDADRLYVDGISCVTPARNVFEMAGSLDSEALEALVESARRMGLLTITELERRLLLPEHRRTHGIAKIRHIVEHNRGIPASQSRLEVKTARLLRESSLPSFQRHVRIRCGADGTLVVDYARGDERLIVESDGFRWHGNQLQWKRDRRRVASLEARGWRVLFHGMTARDVGRRPEQPGSDGGVIRVRSGARSAGRSRRKNYARATSSR